MRRSFACTHSCYGGRYPARAGGLFQDGADEFLRSDAASRYGRRYARVWLPQMAPLWGSGRLPCRRISTGHKSSPVPVKPRLNLGEFNHWAAPLKESVLRVLAENLSALIPTDRVLTFPWPRPATIDDQIIIDLIRFDGTLGGEVVLLARWRILDKDGKERLMKRSHYHTASGTQDYEAMVNAMSRMLESLSREIATALNLTRAKSQRQAGVGLDKRFK